MFQVAPFIINQVEHDLSLCLWLVTFSNGTLQPNQLNPRVTLETDGLNYSLRFLLDAALIPLIEDLFKELAMIEACNKVRKEKRGKCDTILSGNRDTITSTSHWRKRPTITHKSSFYYLMISIGLTFFFSFYSRGFFRR